jgi:hypothetical protein
MRLKAERRFKLHIIKLHYDSLGRKSLEPSEVMVALLGIVTVSNCRSVLHVGQGRGSEEMEVAQC